MGDTRIGTSGWSYPEWVGRFYPPGTTPARMLAYYGRRFRAVEAHGTYRRLPTPDVLSQWHGQVPDDFVFVPKAHLAITHRRDLDEVADRVAQFYDALAPLGDKLGPVLFSLPHHEPDLHRLDDLLAALPVTRRERAAAFDLGPQWHTTDVLDRLDRHGATLALVETDERPAPDFVVGPVTYVRLRKSRYTRTDIDAWVERLAKATTNGRDAYAFVKHDDRGDGPRYAHRLAWRLTEAGV